MAISWDTLKTKHVDKPPRILLHAQPKIGKSTFGAMMPNPIFIATEDGLGKSETLRDVPAFLVRSADEFMEAMALIITDPRGHLTLVIDSVDRLQTYVATKVAREHNAKTIDEIPFGRGGLFMADWFKSNYNEAIRHAQSVTRLNILEICHSEAIKESPPDAQVQFTRWCPALSKHVLPVLREDADLIGYATQPSIMVSDSSGFSGAAGPKKAKQTGVGERRIYCQPGGGFLAGSRYSIPDYLPLDFAAVAPYLTDLRTE
jgi:AAA domain